jgi:UV DNA damage repair endonuclease
VKKIGFACKYVNRTKTGFESVKELNMGATTVAWLGRQSTQVAEKKLWDIAMQNLTATSNLIRKVGTLDEHLRMVRIGSDVIPMYTHELYRSFWQEPSRIKIIEQNLSKIGQYAKDANIRLSFHPGQFVCIASDRDDVITRSLEELEYHADMARFMGFGQSKLDLKINVHVSGRRGIAGFDAAWQRMSPELRNCLTLENDEYQQGLDELLALKDKVGIVLDIHHHFIKTGEYIKASDPRIQGVLESWQGVRPTFHYSQSKSELIPRTGMTTMETLLESTSKSKLRAHSDFYTNKDINRWALTHLEWGNMMAESKAKNLASFELFDQFKEEFM